ncbi:MAG: hypothetical protein WAK92_08660, partial [Thiobacillus sp.]
LKIVESALTAKDAKQREGKNDKGREHLTGSWPGLEFTKLSLSVFGVPSRPSRLKCFFASPPFVRCQHEWNATPALEENDHV